MPLQAKLLDVLQDKRFVRVGGTKPVKVDARIIAATNRNLDEMVEKGAFRKDLYYRLMVIPIQVPPLKERPEDTYQLLRDFLKKFCDSVGVHKAFSPEALDALLAYDWPGNVRELENLVERLVVTVDSPVIGLDVLPTYVLKATGHVSRNKTLKVAVGAAEEMLLRDAARRYGSTRKIARVLGISQSSVVRKLKKYGIRPESARSFPATSKRELPLEVNG